MTSLALTGCRTAPLGSYLKALGLLRLVAEQVDPSAAGWWEGDTFRLESTSDAEGVVEFLTRSYQPTPVLSPWNKDSGFKASASSAATKAMLLVEASDDPRLVDYRTAIAVVRELRADPRWEKAKKQEQVTLVRNRLSDTALAWLDAAVVLRPEDPAYPALLGTGGNLGRWELSPTFITRMLWVLDPEPKAAGRSGAWARHALFDVGDPKLLKEPAGQFDPGKAGGLRAGGDALTNPWDFVLMIEGALVWASGVARRLGGSSSMASTPFTVSPSPVGQASLSPGETAKAELWAPLWGAPLRLPAVRHLFAEGRISWSGGQARSGLDVTRAIKALGTDAGVSSFVRHVVAERHGQAPLAFAAGRFHVDSDPDVRVLAELDGWVERFRRAANAKGVPASLVGAAHRVDQAMFAAVAGGRERLQDLLVTVAEAESLAGRTERARADNVLPPVPWLSADDWLPLLDDGTAELRLAASLASSHDDRVVPASAAALLRTLVRPLAVVRTRGGRVDQVSWSRDEPPVAGLGQRPIVEVLADAFVARSQTERNLPSDGEGTLPGVEPWFTTGQRPLGSDVEALVTGDLDLHRLDRLVQALLLLSPTSRRRAWRNPIPPSRLPSPAWRILVAYYSRSALGPKAAPVRLRPRASWARQLAAGDVNAVLAEALLQWELQSGWPPVSSLQSSTVIARSVSGAHLAAALLCDPIRADVVRAANAATGIDTDHPPEGDLS